MSGPSGGPPVELTALSDVEEVAGMKQAACALTAAGEVFCWGGGTYGEQGNGLPETVTTPTQLEGLAGVRHLASGNHEICAFFDTGSTRCWGGNFYGQLGVIGHEDVYVPTAPNAVD